MTQRQFARRLIINVLKPRECSLHVDAYDADDDPAGDPDGGVEEDPLDLPLQLGLLLAALDPRDDVVGLLLVLLGHGPDLEVVRHEHGRDNSEGGKGHSE